MPELELNPTKARMRLLRAVEDGAVTEQYDAGVGWESWVDQLGAGWDLYPATSRYRRVTSEIAKMRAVGWIQLGPYGDHRRVWQITAKGKAVLGTFEEPQQKQPKQQQRQGERA